MITKQMLKAYPYSAQRLRTGRGNSTDRITVTEVETFIAGISDALTHDIFAYRYIDGLSWARIAAETHNTADSCRMIASRYLNMLGVR